MKTDLSRSFKSPSNSLPEISFQILLYLAASVSVLTTLGIIIVLLNEAIHFFHDVSASACKMMH